MRASGLNEDGRVVRVCEREAEREGRLLAVSVLFRPTPSSLFLSLILLLWLLLFLISLLLSSADMMLNDACDDCASDDCGRVSFAAVHHTHRLKAQTRSSTVYIYTQVYNV